jgi:hypothetical protein
LASAAGLSAYLALLGGTLLAIRFYHAGLPVAQAVGEVPFSTLITTALVELLLPAVGFAVAFVVMLSAQGLASLTARADQDKDDLVFKVLIAAVFACALPVNLYWATLWFGIATIMFAEYWAPEVAASLRMKESSAAMIVILVVAAVPVLARQMIEPLNMERVRVEQLGRPTIVADLVAVRDTSIAIARCHHLIVLPMPTSLRIEKLPSSFGIGSTVFRKLGLTRPLGLSPYLPNVKPC